MTSSLGFINLLERAGRTQGNTFTSLVKVMIMDTDEQSDEEIYRTRSGRVPNSGRPPQIGLIRY